MIGITDFKALFKVNVGRISYTKDFLWVTLGQFLSALGTIVGIRLLTEYLSPEMFGEFTLLMGFAVLVTALSVNPILQALIRYYPEYECKKDIKTLLSTIVACLKRSLLPLSFLLFPLSIYIFWIFDRPMINAVLFGLIIIIEMGRNYEQAILNAAKKQTIFAVWSAVEAWFRPFLAIILIVMFDVNLTLILLAYFFASLFVFFIIKYKSHSITGYYFTKYKTSDELKQKIKKYSLPLIPLALIGWASGLGDRYIIGSFMSLADAGIYSAIYGLVSRPFLLVGRVFELSFRPVFQEAVSSSDQKKSKKIFIIWLFSTVTAMMVGCILITLLHSEIAYFLLGENFRSGSYLMVWIALGYSLLVTSYVFERVCYAYDKTTYILWVQCIGVIVGLFATLIGIFNYGLLGAAVAVPIYFGIQLLLSIGLSERAINRSNRLN